MEKNYIVNNVIISDPGDPSVGIFGGTWSIDGEFYFDDKETMNSFRADIKSAFENYSGGRVNVFFDIEIPENVT